jgi:hypothetical protein
MKDLSAGEIGEILRPAKGLKKLTWAQVEIIDEAIDLLGALSKKLKAEVEVTIVIRNGLPRRIKHPLITYELKPTRD